MNKLFSILFLIFVSEIALRAQVNYCLHFPLSVQNTFYYITSDSLLQIASETGDSIRINNKLYYEYFPFGSGFSQTKYLLRHGENQIFALNGIDSSEYLLYDFFAELNESWSIPFSGTSGVNQCHWGSRITLVSKSETIEFNNTEFFNCYQFEHSEHTCFDAGKSTTWFSRDFGMVKFSEITEAGVFDYYLDTGLPDTVSFQGIFGYVGNPCLFLPCLPCIVSSVSVNDADYVITSQGQMFCDEFSWNGYIPNMGDSIYIKGIITPRRDALNDEYCTIEIIDFYKINPTSVNTDVTDLHEFQLMQNFPNPFNNSTNIRFQLDKNGHIKLLVFDLMGRRVKTLCDKEFDVGIHEFEFNAAGLTSGIYFYQVIAGGKPITRFMTFLK